MLVREAGLLPFLVMGLEALARALLDTTTTTSIHHLNGHRYQRVVLPTVSRTEPTGDFTVCRLSIMNCSCRTSTLGVFVRSLTGLRISPVNTARASPVLTPRLAQLKLHNLRPLTIRGRQFSTTARQTQNNEGLAPRSEDHTSSHETTATATNREQPISSELLDQGLADGALLDFSPESISVLSESVSRYTERKRTPRRFKDREPGRGDKHSIESKQLYKRKILPREPRYQPNSTETPRPEREAWQIQKSALVEKFPEGWAPRKRLSPDALDGIRALHQQFPEEYTTEVLSKRFEVSPEAIRRILKSKWKPTTEEDIDRQSRWFKRGKQIWGHMAELGKKPPRRWRQEGVVRDPVWNQKRSGPRTEWPYMPQRPAEEYEEKDVSTHKKLGDNLV